MHYTEKLMWILDKAGEKYDTLEEQERLYAENREFVHSLGLKCDSVGWCDLDLANPGVDEIFGKISSFCAENGWRGRCIYTRKFVGESDWYELVPGDFKDNTICGRIETVTESGEKLTIPIIKAFHEMSATPKSWGRNMYVPERFRNFCLEHDVQGLDFCWLRDRGKYQAEQYFEVFGTRSIPRMAVDFGIGRDPERLQAAGGMLPKIAAVFHELQMIDLPDCYLGSDLPDGGVVYAYIPATFSCSGRHQILIHRDVAKEMIAKKAVSPAALHPVPVAAEVPGGYTLAETSPVPRPRQDFVDAMLAEYEALKNTPRPLRQMTQKDALKILRLAKKERKDDFQKALPKAKRETLAGTAYEPLVPYYAVTNGGFLSDEYELLSHAAAVAENEEFYQTLAAEELTDKPRGVVIAKCADGDAILLCAGEVIRFSHEAPETNAQWPSLHQFIADAVDE